MEEAPTPTPNPAPVPPTDPETQDDSKRNKLYTEVAVFGFAILLTFIFGVWFYLDPSFEPLTGIITGLATVVGLFTIKQKKWLWLLGIVVLAVAAIGLTVILRDFGFIFDGEVAEQVELSVRVANDDSGEPLPEASVLLFFEGTPFNQISDNNGIVTFSADATRGGGRLVVEHRDHQVHEENISLSRNQDITVRLKHKDEDEDKGRVIIRAIDSDSSQPIDGATVLVLLNGDIFEDTTDSNGLSRFTLEFDSDSQDAEVQVNTREYETSYKTLTIQREEILDVKLNPTTQEIEGFDPIEEQAVESSRIFRSTNSREPTSFPLGNGSGNEPIGSIEFIEESEPNNSAEEAQSLAQVGADSPIAATIDLPETNNADEIAIDEDWYSIETKAGETYIIELFNVGNTLTLNSRLYTCETSGRENFAGMFISILDPAYNRVAAECKSNGGGDVYIRLEFTSGIDGIYYLRTGAHSDTVAGSYNLRVLPKYDQVDAKWDESTFEPNNSLSNAFAIDVGWENAISSLIEPHNPTYVTNLADRDSYRFEAIAGQSYVVELFNVGNTIGLKDQLYSCGGARDYYAGLALIIFDPLQNQVVPQCHPEGAGNVHNSVQFTAGSTGTFHIFVFPHSNEVAGSYSLRILPKYDLATASWDGSEPDNRADNAFSLEVGAEFNANISVRDSEYSTNRSDRDWYRFDAVSGNTYIIELFDLDGGLTTKAYRYNCVDGTRDYLGLRLVLFDPSVNEIQRRCDANGTGNVFSRIEFTAGRDGTHYIFITPHDPEQSGAYSVRIEEQ